MAVKHPPTPSPAMIMVAVMVLSYTIVFYILDNRVSELEHRTDRIEHNFDGAVAAMQEGGG